MFIGNLIGYILHFSFHQKWSGIFHHAHLTHHTLYTYNDFTSDKYRSAGKHNSVFLFTVGFIPFILLVIGVGYFCSIGVFYILTILAALITVGLLHNYIHDSFHLRKTWWSVLPWYDKLRDYHKIHHRNTKKNLGIYDLIFDKIFKTFSGIEKI